MKPILAIDFGTTHTVTAVWDPIRNSPAILPDRCGSSATPSVVGIDPNGRLVVGEAASRCRESRPERTIAHVKRLLGAADVPTLGDRSCNSQTVTALLLGELKRCAERELGRPVHDAVVAIPAGFTDVQRVAVRDAGLIAGLNVLGFVHSTTAVALAYAHFTDVASPGGIFAVCDMGGGVLEISIVEITPDAVSVLGTGSDLALGGLELDEVVVAWALDQIRTIHRVDLSSDSTGRQRLRAAAEETKKWLAMTHASELRVAGLPGPGGGRFDVELPVSRELFERLAAPLLRRVPACLEEAIDCARRCHAVDWANLDGVLLSGGSSRLPIFRRLVGETVVGHCPGRERPVRCDLDPDEAAALGAAIASCSHVPFGVPPDDSGRMPSGDETALEPAESEADAAAAISLSRYDLTSHALGINLVAEDKFHRVITKGTCLPVAVKLAGLTNGTDDITELCIDLYQGNDDRTSANTPIGTLLIQELDPLPRGTQQLEVEFRLDLDGVVSASSRDLRTDVVRRCVFKTDGLTRLGPDDIRRCRAIVRELED